MTPPDRLRALLSNREFIVMPAVWDLALAYQLVV